MKTHRLTLLIDPAEKKRIGAQAAALGVSASEFVRKAASMLDADDIAALEGIRSLLPEFEAAIGRIHDNLVAAIDHSAMHEQEIARMRTPAYRAEVLQTMIENPDDDLDAIATLFNSPAPGEHTEASGGTLFERMSNIARAATRAQVAEDAQPWAGEAASASSKKTR